MINNSNKGQGSPNAYFFHVTFHRGDNKWHAMEVHGVRRATFGTEEEAIEQVKDWVEELEAEGNSHLYIHDIHGKIRKEENF